MAYDNLVDAMIGVESGGNRYAKNPRSSATGSGQFIASTWLATVKKHRPDIAQGKTDAQILQLRYNPGLSREMTAAYAKDNQQFLASRGIDPTPGNTYLAHFAGPAGAAALHANPGATVEALLGSAAVQANPFLRGKRGADVIEWANNKMSPAQMQAAALKKRFAKPEATVEGADGATNMAGGSGRDTLSKPLYNAEDLQKYENLISQGQKIAGSSGNAIGAIGGSLLAGYGAYKKNQEAEGKKADDQRFIDQLSGSTNIPPVIRALLDSGDPEKRQLGMNELIKLQGPRAAPDIKTFKTRDPVTGREIEQQATWNPQTGKYEPFSMGGGGGSTFKPVDTAPQAPVEAPLSNAEEAATAGQPMQQQKPRAPSPFPVEKPAPTGDPELDALADALWKRSQTGKQIGAPQQEMEAPAVRRQPKASEEDLGPDIFEGGAADKSLIGDGNVQRFSEGGRGLYRRLPNGGSEPLVESKAASDARARLGEARKNENVVKKEALSSLDQVGNYGRSLIDQPGFDEALSFAREPEGPSINAYGINAGIGTGALRRWADPSDPKWQTYDRVTQFKNLLTMSILKSKPFGANKDLSEGERKFVDAAAGNAYGAPSKAGYLWGINDSVNAAKALVGGASPEEAMAKLGTTAPTERELKAAATDPQALQMVAQKYRTPPALLDEHISKMGLKSWSPQADRMTGVDSSKPPQGAYDVLFGNNWQQLYNYFGGGQ